MYNYCTLFDSNYLSRGLAMHESLCSVSKNFHLYVFAFDDLCFEVLKKMKLKNVTVISLNEFENKNLLKVKKKRSRAEYCWTCSSSTIKYVFSKFKVNNCTYIDADMMFYSDPIFLIKEMGSSSVLIPPHRYSPRYMNSIVSGKYCVEFVTFKNNLQGLKVLNWWVDSCIDWCYARLEDGKFGDQKYLDEFEKRFSGVHALEHLGGGVAPWNVQQYSIFSKKGKIFGVENATNIRFDFVFYHFHGLKFLDNDLVDLSYYHLSNEVIELVYKPYVAKLMYYESFLREKFKINVPNCVPKGINKQEKFYMYITRFLNGNLNILRVSSLIGDSVGKND